jgi:hypothetical protein
MWKTQSQSRLCDKQVISDGIISIVVKRRRQPRLATIVCFASPRERVRHPYNSMKMTPFRENVLGTVLGKEAHN